jgi:hypothetical protein
VGTIGTAVRVDPGGTRAGAADDCREADTDGWREPAADGVTEGVRAGGGINALGAGVAVARGRGFAMGLKTVPPFSAGQALAWRLRAEGGTARTDAGGHRALK